MIGKIKKQFNNAKLLSKFVREMKALKNDKSGLEFMEWLGLICLFVIIVIVAVVIFGHRLTDLLGSMMDTFEGYFS